MAHSFPNTAVAKRTLESRDQLRVMVRRGPADENRVIEPCGPCLPDSADGCTVNHRSDAEKAALTPTRVAKTKRRRSVIDHLIGRSISTVDASNAASKRMKPLRRMAIGVLVSCSGRLLQMLIQDP